MWYIILFILTLALDQITKIIVDANKMHVCLIEGVLNISISYNEGASFSFLHGVPWAQTFFIVLTVVILIAGLAFLMILKPKSKWLNASIALMFSGTIGNFIDRLSFKCVRDFIDVPFFANFNVADSCLCVGAFMVIVYVLFLDKDAIFKKKPAKAENGTAISTQKTDAKNEQKNAD